MLVYSIVGALFGVVATLVILHYKKAGFAAGKLAGVYALWIVGLLALCFGIDWAYASLTETEPQSAAMGLLMFGGIGIILGPPPRLPRKGRARWRVHRSTSKDGP